MKRQRETQELLVDIREFVEEHKEKIQKLHEGLPRDLGLVADLASAMLGGMQDDK